MQHKWGEGAGCIYTYVFCVTYKNKEHNDDNFLFIFFICARAAESRRIKEICVPAYLI